MLLLKYLIITISNETATPDMKDKAIHPVILKTMGSNNSRQLIFGPTEEPNTVQLTGVSTHVLYNSETQNPENVSVSLNVPKGGNGYQIYATSYYPVVSPYQISGFACANDDDYVSERIAPYYDYDAITNKEIIEYTYLYFMSGVSINYPTNRPSVAPSNSSTGSSVPTPGGAVFENEYSVLSCPTSSACLTTRYPYISVVSVTDLVWTITIANSETGIKVFELNMSYQAKKKIARKSAV